MPGGVAYVRRPARIFQRGNVMSFYQTPKGEKALKKHPGANPKFNRYRRGSRYFERSRWIPHVGAKQIEKAKRNG